MKCADGIILSLEDYVTRHQSNAIVGFIIIPIIGVVPIIMGLTFLIILKLDKKGNKESGRGN